MHRLVVEPVETGLASVGPGEPGDTFVIRPDSQVCESTGALPIVVFATLAIRASYPQTESGPRHFPEKI